MTNNLEVDNRGLSTPPTANGSGLDILELHGQGEENRLGIGPRGDRDDDDDD